MEPEPARYLRNYKSNPQIMRLHNIMAVQSRKAWTAREITAALAAARQGIAFEICPVGGKWSPLDCRSHQGQ